MATVEDIKGLFACLLAGIYAHLILNASDRGLEVISWLMGSLRHFPPILPWR